MRKGPRTCAFGMMNDSLRVIAAKKKQLHMIVVQEFSEMEEVNEVTEGTDGQEELIQNLPNVSIHAMGGDSEMYYQTMRVLAAIKKRQIHILID